MKIKRRDNLARKTKSVKKETPSEKNEEIKLSEQEVWDVLKFAQSLYNGVYQNVATPELVNSRMKDITLQPQLATLDKINEALSHPKDSEEQLIGYSQWLELNSILYKRILLYFSGLLSFDFNYIVKNIKDEKEYASPKFKSDLAIVQDFFDKFNVKEQFKTVMREMMRNESYYGVLRDQGEKYILQELPRQYCKITGRFDYGLLMDFNLYWFLGNPGVSLDMYPPSFTRHFRKFMEAKQGQYNPSTLIGHRDSSWVYWQQLDPIKDNAVVFKLIPEIATNVPFLAAFMPDAVSQPLIRSLQTDSYIAQASKLIAGQVPFLKDAKSSVKDALALDPTSLGKFLALMQSALPRIIKIVSAPLENISALEFDGSNEIYESYLSTSASASGINSRLLFSKDRANLLETKLSLDVDQNILRPVYEMFANMLEFWINQRTSKYKFKFVFEGFETALSREERLNTAFKYAESGIVLEQKFASALGVSPFDFRRMLAETRANKFVEKMTPIIKASQMPADGAGRPKKADGDLSESGSETREAGSNDEKGEE